MPFFLVCWCACWADPVFPDLHCTEPLLIRRCCRYKLSGRGIYWHCYLSYFENLLYERWADSLTFLAYKTLQNMRERLAEKLLRMPMGTIIETGPGELKKSFLENVEDMELILAHALPEGLANLLSF